jgi:hypothetical protein
MTYRGRVQGGMVVLPAGAFPDGTEVDIAPVENRDSLSSNGNGSLGKRLAALGRSVESQPTDLPRDLAKNHDHYLHGLPKRA